MRRWAVLWAVFDTALRYRAMAQRRERAAAALGRSRELLAAALEQAPDPAGDKAAQLEYDLRALDECGEALQVGGGWGWGRGWGGGGGGGGGGWGGGGGGWGGVGGLG